MRQFGKFRLVELLASGGMADVWRAEMPGAAGFVKEIALKLVRGEHREDDAFTRMFIQEARLASRLDHANIVHVFDLGRVDGHYYIAMELVRGRSLRDVTDRCREMGVRFGVPRAVHVGAEVARALAYAHRLEVDGRPAGLVHRDVSPHNVLVSIEGEVKLADFGIARAAGADELTRAGTIKGKLAYMSPEQARGEPVDGRADVFSLGVVLWELCTGRRLFAREGEAATLAAVLDATPVSRPSEWNDAVPPELDEVLLGALQRDRDHRTGSAEALAATLSALRLRLAASPDEIDLRALLRRLWPDGGSSAQSRREPTAVMAAQPVPVAAERSAGEPSAPVPEPTPRTADAAVAAMRGDGESAGTEGAATKGAAMEGAGAEGAGAEGAGAAQRVDRAPALEDAPTRTMRYPRPFTNAQQQRRTLSLLALVAFAVVLAVVVLRWSDASREESRTTVREDGRAGGSGPPASGADASKTSERGAPARGSGPASAPPGTEAQSTGPRGSPSQSTAPQSQSQSTAPQTQTQTRSTAPQSQSTAAQSQSTAPQSTAPQTQTQSTRPEGSAQRERRPGAAVAGAPARERATLVVDVVPWATIYVDGERAGDTPLSLELSAGAHDLRAVHPRFGSAKARVELAPGERRRWAPTLARSAR
ncbi:MAG TPA: protein kinase [Anaeromyxobacteraceae bacterium]|nr:protein kinase [Anaeromyxobacteraceae bacterium]